MNPVYILLPVVAFGLTYLLLGFLSGSKKRDEHFDYFENLTKKENNGD